MYGNIQGHLNFKVICQVQMSISVILGKYSLNRNAVDWRYQHKDYNNYKHHNSYKKLVHLVYAHYKRVLIVRL